MSSRPLCVVIALACASAAAGPATAADLPADLPRFVKDGKFSLNARVRGEWADQDNLRESTALTLRTRLGFTTAPLEGFQAMIEGENVGSLGPRSNYNAAGTNPGGAGRTVIADPPDTAVNQAWLSFKASELTLKAGRQRILLDNARFVGDVGWRQNQQTFDGGTLAGEPVKGWKVYYGYLSRINRVFGDRAPQPDWDSDSHLGNVSYSIAGYGTLTAYAYLLDLATSRVNSSDTIGASFTGSRPLNSTCKLTYRAEAASQRGASGNPLSYRTGYWLAEIGGAVAPWDFALGHEVLGSDGGRKGFATPFATLHAFNGWADVFLTTPARGLRDTYASVGVALPMAMPLKLAYHEYRSDVGSQNFGREWNLQISRKFGKPWTALVKAAAYDGKPPFFDTRRVWLQAEYAF